MNRNMMYNLSGERKYPKTLLSKIEVSPQRRGVRREMIFYLAVKDRQIKTLFYVGAGIICTPMARKRNFESIRPEGESL